MDGFFLNITFKFSDFVARSLLSAGGPNLKSGGLHFSKVFYC